LHSVVIAPCRPLGTTRTTLALLSALPFAVLAAYVARHSVNVPWGEGWYYARTIVIPAYDGTLTFGALWEQYIDNRIVMTRLLTVALTHLTRWDVRMHSVVAMAQAMAVFAFGVATFARGSRRGAAVVALPFSMLIFAVNMSTIWLRQYNDMLFPLLFLMIGAWRISAGPPRWRDFVLAAVCALGATLSNLIGAFTWLAMLPGLWAAGYRRPTYYGIWAALSGLVLATYLHGFQFEPSAFAGSPLGMLWFAAALLGSAFSRSVPTAIAVTVVGIALATFDLFVLRRTYNVGRRVSAWVTLMAHGLLSALATSAGRAYMGASFAVAQAHYTVMSTSLWLGIVALSVMTLEEVDGHVGRPVRIVNLAALLVLLPFYVHVNVQAGRQFVLPIHVSMTGSGDTPYGPTAADEACVRRTVITKQRNCFHSRFWFGPWYAGINDELARRRLGPFGRMEHVAAALPPAYEPADWIIVYAPFAAQHVPLIDDIGRPVPGAKVLHVMADDQRPLYLLDALPDARAVAADALAASLASITSRASRVWYLATADDMPVRRLIEAALRQDFVSADTLLDPATRDRLLYPVVMRFDRREDAGEGR
jgi:hypothetical protein